MIDDLIQVKVLSKDWTFGEISNLITTIDTLSNEIYSELKLTERFELIREYKINDMYIGNTFEDAFREAVITFLKGEIANKIRIMLNTATVSFGDKNVSERSVGGKPHKECSTDEKEDSENEE